MGNLQASFGGRDEETLDQAKQRAPAAIRARCRAVTADDFEFFAGEAANIARARALPLRHPDFPDVAVPGVVTVVVVPDSEDPEPRPERGNDADGLCLPRPAPAADDRGVRRATDLPGGQRRGAGRGRRLRRPGASAARGRAEPADLLPPVAGRRGRPRAGRSAAPSRSRARSSGCSRWPGSPPWTGWCSQSQASRRPSAATCGCHADALASLPSRTTFRSATPALRTEGVMSVPSCHRCGARRTTR